MPPTRTTDMSRGASNSSETAAARLRLTDGQRVARRAPKRAKEVSEAQMSRSYSQEEGAKRALTADTGERCSTASNRYRKANWSREDLKAASYTRQGRICSTYARTKLCNLFFLFCSIQQRTNATTLSPPR